MAPLFKLSPDETLRMVQEYKKHELLHNKSHELYKDTTARRSALKSIGDVLQLNKSVNEINRKLKSLRSTFILEQNKKNENNEYIPKLIWYNEMASFIPFTLTGKSRICANEQSIGGQLPQRHDVTRRRLKRLTVSRRGRSARGIARRMVKPPMSVLLEATSTGQPSLQHAASRHKAVRFEMPDLKTIRKENAFVDEWHVGTELTSVENGSPVDKDLSGVTTKEKENSQNPVEAENCDEVSLGSGEVQSTPEVEKMGSQTYKKSTRSRRTRTQLEKGSAEVQKSAAIEKMGSQTNRKRKTSVGIQTDLPDEAELSCVEMESSEDEDLAVVTRNVGVNRPGWKKTLPPSYLGAARGEPPLPPRQRYATLATVPVSNKKRFRSIENGVSENCSDSTSLAAKTQSQGSSSYQATANRPGPDSQEISETSETSHSEDDILIAYGKFINLSLRKLDMDSFLDTKTIVQKTLKDYRAYFLQEMADANNEVTDDSGQQAQKNKSLLLQALNSKPNVSFKVLVNDDDEYDAFTYEIVHQLRTIPGHLYFHAQSRIMTQIIAGRLPDRSSDEEESASEDESTFKERSLPQEQSNLQEQVILDEECTTSGETPLKEILSVEKTIHQEQSNPQEQVTLSETPPSEPLFQKISSRDRIIIQESRNPEEQGILGGETSAPLTETLTREIGDMIGSFNIDTDSYIQDLLNDVTSPSELLVAGRLSLRTSDEECF